MPAFAYLEESERSAWFSFVFIQPDFSMLKTLKDNDASLTLEEKLRGAQAALEGLAAQLKIFEIERRVEMRRLLAAVTVSPIRVRGSLAIVIADLQNERQQKRQELLSYLAQLKEEGLQDKRVRMPKDRETASQFVEQVGKLREMSIDSNYDAREIEALAISDAIKAGKIFDRVEIVRWKGPDEDDTLVKYDYVFMPFKGEFGLFKTSRFNEGIPIQSLSSPDEMNRAIAEAAQNLAKSGTKPNTKSNDRASTNQPQPQAQPSVKSTASAFFVNGKGIAVTNQHVVNRCANPQARLRSGELAPVSVLATDRQNDLALVKVTTHNQDFAQLRLGLPAVRQGEQVVVYGYPLSDALASQGVFSTGAVSALAGLFDNTRELQISAPIQPGNSGGPLLDQSGNVIGMVSSVLDAVKAAKETGIMPQNVNFAIKASMISGFLEANSVDFSTKTSSKILSNEDVGDRAKSFTFRIDCQ